VGYEGWDAGDGSVGPLDDTWPTPEGCDLTRPWGFVSMITGYTRVIDLCSCDRDGDGRLEQVLPIKHGSFITHGVGVDRARRETWIGNQDTNEVWRLKIARDLGSWETLARISIPTAISTVSLSPNRRLIGVGPALPGMVPFQRSDRGECCAVFVDTGLNRVVASVPTDSPASVFYSLDSKRAYVPNINHRNFVVIDLETFEVVKKVDLPWPEDRPGVGPSPFCELSRDGRWFVVPGIDAHRLWVYDVENDFEDPWYVDTPDEMPHMATLRQDPGKPHGHSELWFSTLGWWPDPMNEDENPSIPSFIWVIDFETQEVKDRFAWILNGDPTVIAHVEITNDNDMVWGSGSYGSIVGFDIDTHEERCSVNLETGPEPAMVLDY